MHISSHLGQLHQNLMTSDQVRNMDNHIFSFLFFLLLAGTFVHARSIDHFNDLTHQRTKRAASPDLTLESVNDLLVVTNSTAKVAMVLDLKNKLYALLDGTTGSAIVVNPKALTAVTIPKGVWKQDDSSLEDVLKSLSNGLKDLTAKDGAVDGISDLDNAAKIIAGLVKELDENIIRAPLQAVRLISHYVFIQLVEQLDGPLDGLLDVLKDKQVTLPFDLLALTNTLRAVGKVNKALHVTVSSLVDKGIKINLDKFLESKNGLEAFLQLVSDVGGDLSMAPLSGLADGIPGWLALIAELGGSVPVGINGIIRILADVGTIPEHIDTTVILFNDLIKYATETPADAIKTIQDDLNKALKDLLDGIKEVKADKDLSDAVDLINDALDKQLKIDGADLSKVIDLLSNGLKDGEPLTVIIKVLLALDPILPAVQVIPAFLLVLITKLDSAHGVELEKQLNIPLDIDVDSIKGSILKSVLSSAGDLQRLKGENVYDALTKLKVLKDIVKSLDENLKKADDSLDLKSLLDRNSIIQDLIKAVVQLITGEDLGASSEDLSEAGIVISNSASLRALTHLG